MDAIFTAHKGNTWIHLRNTTYTRELKKLQKLMIEVPLVKTKTIEAIVKHNPR